MNDPALASLVDCNMRAAQVTLPELQGIDLNSCRQELLERFRNPSIAHETFQIAMDGTEKLPQRILAPAVETLASGGDFRPFAFAVAAWMRYCLGRTEDGANHDLRDPRQPEIAARLAGCSTAEHICNALHQLPGLFDPSLKEEANWLGHIKESLGTMLADGMELAIQRQAALRCHLG